MKYKKEIKYVERYVNKNQFSTLYFEAKNPFGLVFIYSKFHKIFTYV